MELPILLLNVAFVWTIAVITPGPNFFITVQTAIGRSRQSALFVVLGIGTGTVIWALSGFLGITLLFRTAPWAYVSVKLLGGGYLVYLGMKLICSKPGKIPGENALLSKNMDPLRSYKLGLLTNLTNPKTAAFVTSLFAAVMPADATYSVALISVALMALISIVWYTAVAYVFSLEQFRTVSKRAKVWVDRVAGIIFIGFGIRLAASE